MLAICHSEPFGRKIPPFGFGALKSELFPRLRFEQYLNFRALFFCSRKNSCFVRWGNNRGCHHRCYPTVTLEHAVFPLHRVADLAGMLLLCSLGLPVRRSSTASSPVLVSSRAARGCAQGTKGGDIFGVLWADE